MRTLTLAGDGGKQQIWAAQAKIAPAARAAIGARAPEALRIPRLNPAEGQFQRDRRIPGGHPLLGRW